jgi:protein TonB
MKTAIAVDLIKLTLSLCNLMGKRSNTNTNGNSRYSGEMTEASPTSSPAEQNSNRTVDAPPPPITQGVPRAGAPGSLPAANHNSAASEPPPPPKAPVTPAPPKTISGGVLNGKATSLPKPAYPPIARAAHASGAVNVQVTIDENGNVISASPVSGHPLLRQSAASAARQAKFSPTIIGGQRVKVTGVIIYNFVEQ